MTLNYLKGRILINECLFEGNKTNGEGTPIKSTYDGGAIYVFDGGNSNVNAYLTITNTTFANNLAYDDGGAMMIQGTGDFLNGLTTIIDNCTFYNNRAYGLSGGNRSGGAIQFFKNSGFAKMSTTIRSSTFVGNRSGNENSAVDQQGGAIGLSGSSLVASATYNGSLFVGNKVYGSNGQLNNASTYKDISNSTTTQAGTTNVINVDKGATPVYQAEDVLGKNYSFCENLSGIKAGVDDEIIKTIPIKPEGIADVKYTGTTTLPATDQRGYNRNKDHGAIEMAWVRFNAGDGEWTELNDSHIYDGVDYYESALGVSDYYYKVTYSGGTVAEPAATLAPPAGYVFDKWVLERDGTTEWEPTTAVTDTLRVIALYEVPPPTNYYVTYKPGTGSGTDYTVSEEDGNTHSILNYNNSLVNFTPPANHVFNGWKDGVGNSFTAGGTITMTSDTTLIAQWKDNTTPPEPIFAVTYQPNGGGGYDHTINCDVDWSHIILNYTDSPLNYTEPGVEYVFVNWNTEPDGSGYIYTPGMKAYFFSNTDLYAQWEKKINPPTPPTPTDPDPGIVIKPMDAFCPTDASILIPYEVLYMQFQMEYSVFFSEEAKAVGFRDIGSFSALSANYIVIPMPANVPKGKYRGKIVLGSSNDANIVTDYPFEFSVLSGVVIIEQPESVVGCQGDGYMFSVTASGDALTYQWYHNGEKIIGATSAEYGNSLSSETEGLYYVVISGACGSLKSDSVYATTNALKILMKWDDVLYVENMDDRYTRFQWYKNGETVSQYGTSIYYTEEDGLDGTYFVRAYFADGTYDESCALHFASDGLQTSVKVYPNPVLRNSSLNIESPVLGNADSGRSLIELFDLSGRKLYSSYSEDQITSVPVNTSPGVYLLHVTVPNGKKTIRKVVVK